MTLRVILGRVFLLVSLPLVFFGLIDPLEGGISLLAAAASYTVAFTLLQTAPPKYLWIPFTAAIVVGGASLAWAILTLEFTTGPSRLPIPVLVGLWAYRVAVVWTLVGGVITVIRAFRRQ